jgi:hypothetical protein
MTTVTRQDRGMRPIAEPLAERFAQVLWADDEEQRQRADLQQYGRAGDVTPWDLADQWDHAEYRDRARRVLDRVLP